MKVQHWLLSIYIRVPPSSSKGRYIALQSGGIPGTYGEASSPFSCLHPGQVVGWLGSLSFRLSLAVALLPETSGLRWRHLPFGLTVCCMPLGHCVETLHPHRSWRHLCFGCCTHCCCPPSHSHPHCSLRHHCSLHQHCSLHHHCFLHHHCSLHHH